MYVNFQLQLYPEAAFIYFIYLFILPLFNQVGKLRTSSHLQLRPGQDIIVAGYFNKTNLRTRLPKFYQHIDCSTRAGKTLDHRYSNYRIAYKALLRQILPRFHFASPHL